MAAAAAVAAVVFGTVVGIISGVGVGALFFTVGAQTNPLVVGGVAVAAAVSWLTAAGTSLGIVVPGGFVDGVVVWRFVPESFRLGGLVGGLLSTLVGYAVCWALLLRLGAFYTIAVDPSVATVTGSALERRLLLGFISVYTSWAAVPVGLLMGGICTSGHRTESSTHPGVDRLPNSRPAIRPLSDADTSGSRNA